VDPDDIALVVATHWHDDHIKGLSAVFRAASRARFVCAAALDVDEFFTMVQTHDERAASGDYSSGVREMRAILNELDERGAHVNFAFQDTLVARVAGAAIYALSPSSATCARAYRLFRPYLIPGTATIPRPDRNDLSVVLWIESGEQLILLGGDLEGTGDAGMGWQAIHTALVPAGRQASVFKIPHHGSAGADHPDTWRRLLDEDVPALLTPFTRLADPLPTSADRERINEATSRAFVAGGPLGRIRRDSMVRRMIRSATVVEPRRATGPLGQVRLRAPTGSSGPEAWTETVLGPAGPL
jgi:hypothetical protein